MKQKPACLVVGAGISGLLAARRLADAGVSVTVVDKARGVGGRMATRRIDQAIFDHGAQVMSARDEQFRTLLAQWQSLGLVAEWGPRFAGPPSPPFSVSGTTYAGMPSMTSVPKHLASSLDVRLSTRIVSLATSGKRWIASAESGNRFEADAILMTPPLPQTLTIFEQSGIELPEETSAELAAIIYQPVIALLALLDGPSAVPEPGGVFPENDEVRWIADNKKKGISPHASALTIHATPEFSAAHFEKPPEDVVPTLMESAKPFLGSRVLQTSFHRWRFSEPMMHLHVRAMLALESPLLVLAGDAFGSPRVEGASLSGLAAAELLLESLEKD